MSIDNLPQFEDGGRKIGTIQPKTQVIDEQVDPEERLALAAKTVCGQCRHFDLKAGQQEMLKEKFQQALTSKHELDWKLRHLGAPLNDFGFCGANNSGAPGEPRMITAKLNPSCDAYREDKGFVQISMRTSNSK